MLKGAFNYLRIIPVVTTYFLAQRHIVTLSNADGASMEPTIHSGDIVLIDRFFYKYFNPLKKDDIVVAVQPVNPEVTICKRIKEVGGGTIPYGSGISVPPLHFWLQGDNKNQSYDSRHHGCVPQNLIVGKVLFVLPL